MPNKYIYNAIKKYVCIDKYNAIKISKLGVNLHTCIVIRFFVVNGGKSIIVFVEINSWCHSDVGTLFLLILAEKAEWYHG